LFDGARTCYWTVIEPDGRLNEQPAPSCVTEASGPPADTRFRPAWLNGAPAKTPMTRREPIETSSRSRLSLGGLLRAILFFY
jgi:hypothetical protein